MRFAMFSLMTATRPVAKFGGMTPTMRCFTPLTHDLAADDVAFAIEAILSDAIAEQNDFRSADAVLVFGEIASDDRCDAEGSEHRPRDGSALDELSAVAVRQVVRAAVVGRDAQRPISFLPTPEVRVRDGIHMPPTLRMRFTDRDQLIRILIWKRSKQERANAAEDPPR